MLLAFQAKGTCAARTGPLGERQGERGCSETQRGLRLLALGPRVPASLGLPWCQPGQALTYRESS